MVRVITEKGEFITFNKQGENGSTGAKQVDQEGKIIKTFTLDIKPGLSPEETEITKFNKLKEKIDELK